MEEWFRVCRNKPNHRFNAAEAYKYIDTCPYCKCPMDLVKEEVRPPRASASRSSTRPSEAYGLFRGQEIDKLPRLAWFSEATNINEVEQKRARDVWTLGDAKKLLGLYNEHGVSDHTTWKEVAKDLGRSLYAIERQLRIVIAYGDSLEKYFPNI
jgi:hypothetical protein